MACWLRVLGLWQQQDEREALRVCCWGWLQPDGREVPWLLLVLAAPERGD